MGATDKIRGKSDKDGLRKVTEIGILLYPGAQASAVAGLTDLFMVANRLSAERGGPCARELRMSHWRVEGNRNQLKRVFDTHKHLAKHGLLVALILPPSRTLWQIVSITRPVDCSAARRGNHSLLNLCRSISTRRNRTSERALSYNSLDSRGTAGAAVPSDPCQHGQADDRRRRHRHGRRYYGVDRSWTPTDSQVDWSDRYVGDRSLLSRGRGWPRATFLLAVRPAIRARRLRRPRGSALGAGALCRASDG
jgi:hypothetical protein